MNRDYDIAKLQLKMDANVKHQNVMKLSAVFAVMITFFIAVFKLDYMENAWTAGGIIIILLFLLNLYYVKMNKQLEYQIYSLEVGPLREKKSTAEIRRQVRARRAYRIPSDRMVFPLVFYLILVILEAVIYFFLIK